MLCSFQPIQHRCTPSATSRIPASGRRQQLTVFTVGYLFEGTCRHLVLPVSSNSNPACPRRSYALFLTLTLSFETGTPTSWGCGTSIRGTCATSTRGTASMCFSQRFAIPWHRTGLEACTTQGLQGMLSAEGLEHGPAPCSESSQQLVSCQG